MSPKVKTMKSSETRARNKLNKSSLQSSNIGEENRSDWIESEEPLYFDETINSRGPRSNGKKSSVKIIFPSKSGSTRCPDNSKAKYTAKFYRRRLKQCKTLIKILISTKRKTCVKKYIRKSVRILDESHKCNSCKNRSVEEDGVEEENPRAPRIDVIDVTSDSEQDNNARKSGGLSEPAGKKIPGGKSVPSTSKQFDESDDESIIRPIMSERKYRHQQNLKRQNLSDSSDDITIITREQSKKESQGLRSKETKGASESSSANAAISWSTVTRSQKNIQKWNSRMKDSEDQPKCRDPNSAINSSKITATSKSNEKAATLSKSKNFNPSEIVDKKSKPTAPVIGCFCKSKKLNSVPTLSYKIPSSIENPASKFCNHDRGKSGQDVKIEETSLIREKKTKKSYSPLELKYSEGSVQRSRSDNKNKENDDLSEPSHQASKNPASHKRGSKNSGGTAACSEPVGQNLSKQSRCATFSKYSIPVSIEIHMIPDRMRARNFGGNLKQSKLTEYYSLGRAQRKNVDSNPLGAGGRNNRDENGNKVVAGCQNPKPRALPVVQSDVLLQRPRLSISRQEYLYGLLKCPLEQAQSAANQNIIFCNNVTLSQQYNVTNEPADYDLKNPDTIDDSDYSIVPPSYTVDSDDANDDPRAIGADFSLDTEQWEEMFAPWDKVDNLENVNRWNVGKKMLN